MRTIVSDKYLSIFSLSCTWSVRSLTQQVLKYPTANRDSRTLALSWLTNSELEALFCAARQMPETSKKLHLTQLLVPEDIWRILNLRWNFSIKEQAAISQWKLSKTTHTRLKELQKQHVMAKTFPCDQKLQNTMTTLFSTFTSSLAH